MKNNSAVRVLVSAVGSTTALSAIKGFRRGTLPVYILGTDSNSHDTVAGSVFCDAFERVPLFHSDEYIPKMLEVCEKHKIQVIVPIVDEEVLLLSQNKAAFLEKGIHIVASSHETVLNCNDKLKTYQALLAQGVETTPTWLLEEVEASSVIFPLFSKPRKGLSSRGISLISTVEELQSLRSKSSDCVVQPYYPGTLYVVDVLNTTDGKNIFALPRIEHESKSGVGVKSTTTHNDTLTMISREVSEALGICGPANIEFIQTEDGEFHFIEINPRFSAGSILSTVAGVNIHQQALELFLGKDRNEALEFLSGVTMTRYWQEVYYRDGEEFGSQRDEAWI